MNAIFAGMEEEVDKGSERMLRIYSDKFAPVSLAHKRISPVRVAPVIDGGLSIGRHTGRGGGSPGRAHDN